MTQDARHDCLLGDGGNDPERAATTERTRGHSQRTHAPQQSCPAPVRCARLGLFPIHTLLARRRDDRPSQLTVRRQTPAIAEEMDPWQGHERCQFFHSSNGDRVMPVVPSDHGLVNV